MSELLETVWRNSVGFDDLFNRKAVHSFPFYNISKLGSAGNELYSIELALAGYNIDDIDIVVSQNTLEISSKGSTGAAKDANIIHRGFTARPFTRSFTLRDNVEVNSAKMVNGILAIVLEHIVPEEKKTRKITISNTDTRKLLNE